MIRDHARLHLPGFLVQVLATAVGLMLALGLDQWKDQRRQAALAQAHLAAIQAELKANDAEIAVELDSFQSDEALLEKLSTSLRSGKRVHFDGHLSLSIASLRQSAWDMAVAGQTPLRTHPDRMMQLANAYESLRVLRSMQDRFVDHLDFLGELQSLEKGKRPSPGLADQIDAVRARMALLRSMAPSIRRDISHALAP